MSAQSYKLKIARWEGSIRCVYLNDYRVAGGKPWGGCTFVATFNVTAKDLREALPELRREHEALEWIANHDNIFLTDGSAATRACIDALIARAKSALADGTGKGPVSTTDAGQASVRNPNPSSLNKGEGR